MDSVSFKLSQDMLARLETIAQEDDVSVGQVIRTAIERDFHRRDTLVCPPRAGERVLALVRSRVQEDFANAAGWSDLKARLGDKGYSLRESGGGLALHEIITGRFLCRTSEIGFGYPSLLRKFSSPFPGHSHTWLLDKLREIPVYMKR